jgi:catechol-2,3-dioxygenase
MTPFRDKGVTIAGAGDHTITHSLYIFDPDGNEVELYIDVPGVDWRLDPDLIMAPVRALALQESAETALFRAAQQRSNRHVGQPFLGLVV